MLYDAKRFDFENNLFRGFFIYFFVAESPVFFGVGLTTRGKVFYNYYTDRGGFSAYAAVCPLQAGGMCRKACGDGYFGAAFFYAKSGLQTWFATQFVLTALE